jgi:uncharacterized protein (TIGR00251 family)
VGASPFEAAKDGVRAAVRVTPKAASNRIQGLVSDADGRVRIRVAVTDPPEDGRANEAVTRLLAKAWKVPRSTVSVAAGRTDRSKVLLVAADDPPALLERLTAWAAGLPPA